MAVFVVIQAWGWEESDHKRGVEGGGGVVEVLSEQLICSRVTHCFTGHNNRPALIDTHLSIFSNSSPVTSSMLFQ